MAKKRTSFAPETKDVRERPTGQIEKEKLRLMQQGLTEKQASQKATPQVTATGLPLEEQIRRKAAENIAVDQAKQNIINEEIQKQTGQAKPLSTQDIPGQAQVQAQPLTQQQSTPQGIQAQAQAGLQDKNSKIVSFLLDPLAPLASAGAQAVEGTIPGTPQRSFNEAMLFATETVRAQVRNITKHLTKIRVGGIGVGANREREIRQTLSEVSAVKSENLNKMNLIVSATEAGQIEPSRAAALFEDLNNQNLQMERELIQLSKDPLAFTAGSLIDDMTEFENYRNIELPIMRQKIAQLTAQQQVADATQRLGL